MARASCQFVHICCMQGLNGPGVHLLCHLTLAELTVAERAPGPETLFFTDKCKRVVLTASDCVDLDVLEADDSTRHCHVVCELCILVGSIQHRHLHLFDLRLQAKLTQVIDAAPIELILCREEQRKSRAADDFGHCDLRRHILSDLCWLRLFALGLPIASRLE